MQPRPIGDQPARRQPHQRHKPAVVLRQAAHQLAHPPCDGEEECQKRALPRDALHIEQDQRQHRPDRQIIQTGIAQQALTQFLAEDLQLFHQQHQNGQGRYRTGHADAEHALIIEPFRPQPSRPGQDQHRRRCPCQERHSQRKTSGDRGFAPSPPRSGKVQLHPGDKDEHHHRPPGNTVQCANHLGREDGLVIGRERRAHHAGAQDDARHDLHHNQRRVIVGAQDAPHQIGQTKDDC